MAAGNLVNNVANLSYGMYAENMADRERDGHTIRGVARHNAKLTPTRSSLSAANGGNGAR